MVESMFRPKRQSPARPSETDAHGWSRNRQGRIPLRRAFLFLFPLLLLAAAAQCETPSPWGPLVRRLAADGLDKAALDKLFSEKDVRFHPEVMTRKVDSMVRKEFDPPRKVDKRTLEKSAYKKFLTPWTLAWASQYMDENKAALDRAEREYAVPPEIVTAVLLVETKLGTYLGDKRAFNVLASMALCENFSLIQKRLKSVKGSPQRLAFAKAAAKKKADWAYAEFTALLAYAAANKQNPLTFPGSVYGAIGVCQFMPSNALKFGVDADGDGGVDLFTTRDAIVSVASYFKGHGWKEGLGRREQKDVVYAYNHSDLYVLAVMTIADKLRDIRTGKTKSQG